MNNDKGGTEIQVTKKTDPGWNQEELEYGFKVGVTTLVERFREAIRGAEDLGETTFNGQRAHAYGVKRPSQRVPPGDTIYYVDPETAEPLGSKTTIVVHEPRVVCIRWLASRCRSERGVRARLIPTRDTSP